MSPEPVTMYLSSVEMSQLNTDDDSFDCRDEKKNKTNIGISVKEGLKHILCLKNY